MILVTGAGGLIGGALARRLMAEGFDVWAPLREKSAVDTLDLSQVSSVTLPAGLRIAFLCAWHGGVVEAANDSKGTWRINVEGSLKLVDRLKQTGTKVIFLSSSLVFSGAATSAMAPLAPCCVYGQQKAAVEAGLDARGDAIVRVTKVGETLMPRLSQWASTLREGGEVAAAGHLRVAPVMLDEVVGGLVDLARDFKPGIYQMSAVQDVSYLDLARMIASKTNGLVVDDPQAGKKVFHTFPITGLLQIASPNRSKCWPQGCNHTQRLVQTALS